MIQFITVGVVSGILFAILDGVINANPVAQRLYAVYKPIARTSINPIAGIAIDLVYGFVMAGVFLLLYTSLPGETGLLKGVSFAVLVSLRASALSCPLHRSGLCSPSRLQRCSILSSPDWVRC